MPIYEYKAFQRDGQSVTGIIDADEELEILVGDKRIGYGRAVKVGENFGIRVTHVGDIRERIGALGPVAAKSDDDTEELLEAASVSNLPPEAGDERTRIWNERFYWFAGLALLLLLPLFRRSNPGYRLSDL